MTALNPTLLATWSGAVAAVHAMGLGVTPQLGALPFGVGALVGVAGWFALWLAVLRKFRTRIQPATIDQVVRGMGALLVVLGGWAAVRSLMRPG
jgi:threonine/homoserine/homoserine lactone efflux protein